MYEVNTTVGLVLRYGFCYYKTFVPKTVLVELYTHYQSLCESLIFVPA